MNVDFKAMASEIVKLLDAAETDEKTRGDGKIEGSIWAQYSGTDEADRISQSDAEIIIAAELEKKGVPFVQGVLRGGLKINWQPKEEAEPKEVSESKLRTKMVKLFDRFKNDIKENPEIVAEILFMPPGVPNPKLLSKGAKALANEINSDSALKKYIKSHKDEVDKYAKGIAQGVAFGAVSAMPGGVAGGAAIQILAKELTPEQKQTLTEHLRKVAPIVGEMMMTLPSPFAMSIKLTEQLKNELIECIRRDDYEGLQALLLKAKPAEGNE